MSFRLGVFDVFANAIPGAVLLTVLGYAAWRLDALNAEKVLETNPVVFLFLGFGFSMILGTLMFPIGRWVTKKLWSEEKAVEEVIAAFRLRSPAHANSPFVSADRFYLLRGLQVGGVQGADIVEKYRADGILLRNTAVATAIGAAIAVVEVWTSDSALVAVLVAIVLALISYHALRESSRRSQWAHSTTLDLTAWWSGSSAGFEDQTQPG